MATHSSILARRISWTEEPGGLQSVALQSRTRQGDRAQQSPSRKDNSQVLHMRTTRASQVLGGVMFTNIKGLGFREQPHCTFSPDTRSSAFSRSG